MLKFCSSKALAECWLRVESLRTKIVLNKWPRKFELRLEKSKFCLFWAKNSNFIKMPVNTSETSGLIFNKIWWHHCFRKPAKYQLNFHQIKKLSKVQWRHCQMTPGKSKSFVQFYLLLVTEWVSLNPHGYQSMLNLFALTKLENIGCIHSFEKLQCHWAALR